MLSKTKFAWTNISGVSRNLNYSPFWSFPRAYAKKSGSDDCRRAIVDIHPDTDPICPKPCARREKKKEGILHRIKLKMIEGGTNFGTPFRRLQCKKKVCKEVVEKPKALPPPKEKKASPMPLPRPGVQVSVLGADTAIGQYVALLLKQCPCIKRLRLYQAKDSEGCTRDVCQVVQDLQHIDTNCGVQAFSCACYELERCLQCEPTDELDEYVGKRACEFPDCNRSPQPTDIGDFGKIADMRTKMKYLSLPSSDIVLMLESGYMSSDTPLEKRFCNQAPIVKCYADAIASECPKAFIIVCASPIDCMVPLVAETLKETGWYDPRKLMGSVAVPEMRASTLAARALCLEPRYTRVPCVGGTEGESLVPLFSKAVEYFDFARHNAIMMTDAVRSAPAAVKRCDGSCLKSADLSEAHALAGLVTKVAHALLCHDIPRVTGFVETDAGQVISPARYIANQVDIGGSGIIRSVGLPKMNDMETTLVNLALCELNAKERMVEDWYCKYCSSISKLDSCQLHFFTPRPYQRFDDCAYANLYLAIDTLLNHKGICKRFDLPAKMNYWELELMDVALSQVTNCVNMAEKWHSDLIEAECQACSMGVKKQWLYARHYDRLDDCNVHLT